LLNHGYSNFSLSIIEYYSIKEIYLKKREDYYLNLLDPEYNILQKAGSSLGYKHSEEARKKMSIDRTGKKKIQCLVNRKQ
jgi:group I intron endonuclease